MQRGFAIAFGLLVALAAQPAHAEPPHLFGLAIGYNGSDRPDQAPLRYADDDAVKNGQLLSDLGADYVLLTELDGESRRLHPNLQPTPPTYPALLEALDQLDQRMASIAGESHLLIFYSGHGDVENGRGYVHLADRRLDRSQISVLFERTRAAQVHLVVDACKSYFLVFERGAGASRQPAVGLFPSDEAEPIPPHVGLLLSASAAQDSHEWEALQAGIFSHEVRSALRGAGDLDNDGSLSYQEVAAFVFVANHDIPNARYRPSVFARAPGGAELATAPLVPLHLPDGAALRIGPDISAHLFVEDGLGNRIADLHPEPGSDVRLLLPASRPLFVRNEAAALEYRIDTAGPLTLAALDAQPASVARRGAAHEAFSKLFSHPFGSGSVAQFELARREEMAGLSATVQRPSGDWAQPLLGASGLALLAGGGVATLLALDERSSVTAESSHLQRAKVNERIERYNNAAAVTYGLAGACLLSYTVWYLWPDPEPPPLQVQVVTGAHNGLFLGGRW